MKAKDNMRQGKQPYILSASCNLMGICFIVITGLKITNQSLATWADEISSVAALMFMISCVMSYLSLRQEKHEQKYENIADGFFLIGMVSLFVAVIMFANNIL
jgi:amino acid transporter